MKRAALRPSAALKDAAIRPALTLVKPFQGPPEMQGPPAPTYQQRQYMEQLRQLKENLAKAPAPVAPWAVMYKL